MLLFSFRRKLSYRFLQSFHLRYVKGKQSVAAATPYVRPFATYPPAPAQPLLGSDGTLNVVLLIGYTSSP